MLTRISTPMCGLNECCLSFLWFFYLFIGLAVAELKFAFSGSVVSEPNFLVSCPLHCLWAGTCLLLSSYLCFLLLKYIWNQNLKAKRAARLSLVHEKLFSVIFIRRYSASKLLLMLFKNLWLKVCHYARSITSIVCVTCKLYEGICFVLWIQSAGHFHQTSYL